MRNRSALVSVALLVVAMSSIQVGAAFAKRLFPVVGTAGASTLRLIFAAIVLCAALRPWRTRMAPEVRRSVLVYGVALAGLNGLFYAALETVPLGIVTALEFSGPLAVAVLSSRRALDFAWIGLAVAGLALLLPLSSASAGVDPVGAAFALGAGVCWALYIVFGQKAGEDHGVQTTAIGVVIAAVIVLPFGIAQGGTARFTPRILPIALGVAVLSTAVPYVLEMVALARLPRKTFGTLMSMEPAIAAVSGLALLGERLAAVQWVAISAIIVASIGTTLTAAARRDPPPLTETPMLDAE